MRIVFIGTGGIGAPVLEMLLDAREHEVAGIVTQPDKPAGRSMEAAPSPIKLMGMRRNVRVFQPVKIRERNAIEEIEALRPEVIVVMAYGQILPGALLRIPTRACLNLHASLLPRHRGAAPIQAAIEAGDRETGITVMYMDEGLDTGDILLQKRMPIRRRETGGTLHDRLGEAAPGALREALALLEEGRAPRVPQENGKATYAPKLDREKGELDWSGSELELDRKIRAMNPWPVAYTWVTGKEATPRKMKIFSTIVCRRPRGKPGEVLRADRQGILVAAGTGGLLLRDVQLEGKKRMSARDFLLGHPIPPGTALGRK